MDGIANLPPIALAFLGGTLAVIIAVSRLGILQGKSGPATVAMIVDPTALNRHADAVLKLSDSIVEVGDILTKISLQMEIGRAVDSERNRQGQRSNDRNDRLDRDR